MSNVANTVISSAQSQLITPQTTNAAPINPIPVNVNPTLNTLVSSVNTNTVQPYSIQPV
jgi:hypothetical protein